MIGGCQIYGYAANTIVYVAWKINIKKSGIVPSEPRGDNY